MNERLNQMYVIRWWSISAVCFMEDLTMNPTEYKILLQNAGDAGQVQVWSVLDLLEMHLENNPEE